MSDLPYRVVDVHDQGWFSNGAGMYTADWESRNGLPRLGYDDLRVQRGPLRPVEPISDEDEGRLTAALVGAGRLAAGSVLVALFRLFRGPDLPTMEERGQSMARRSAALVAGRAGSWESEAISSLAWGPGCDLADKPKRYDPATADLIEAMVWRWVTDPRRFTEVAETLASVFNRHTVNVGGWDKVADRYLIPGGRFSMAATEQVIGYLHGMSSSYEYRETGQGCSIADWEREATDA